MMIKTEQFIKRCSCRSVGECTHNRFVEMEALEKLVKVFGKAKVDKLRRKMFDGKSGWDDEKNSKTLRAFLMQSLREHVEKGDMVDVSNIAMMVWNIDQPG